MNLVSTRLPWSGIRALLEVVVASSIGRQDRLEFQEFHWNKPLSNGLLVTGAPFGPGGVLFVSPREGESRRDPQYVVLCVRSLAAALHAARSFAGEVVLEVEYREGDDVGCIRCSRRQEQETLALLVIEGQGDDSLCNLAGTLTKWHCSRNLPPLPLLPPLPPPPNESVKLPGIHTFILHQGQYLPILGNAPLPVAFRNDLFEGRALLIVRTDDLATQLYSDRFVGNHYTFEVQVQGKFLRVPPGRLFIGAEITKPMSLGLLTKGMCRAILQLGRTVNKYMHHSFGDNQSTELPHIVGPMWSSADRLVVTRGSDAVLPPFGTAFAEDAVSRATRRKNADYELSVDLDATYSVSFKTSNIDLIKWTATNLPLVSNIDLHTFWSDAHLRTVCYCVRDNAAAAAVDGGATQGAESLPAGCGGGGGGGGAVYPKHHRQEDMEYLFSIEMQHESNLEPSASSATGIATNAPSSSSSSSSSYTISTSSSSGNYGTATEPPQRSTPRERRHSVSQNYLSIARATSGHDDEDCDNEEEEEEEEVLTLDHGDGGRNESTGEKDDMCLFFDALDGDEPLAVESLAAHNGDGGQSGAPPSTSNLMETSLKQVFAASAALYPGEAPPRFPRVDRPAELFSYNPHCVAAAIEVDETRLVRQSVGQKGRRTLYAFTVGNLLEGKTSSRAPKSLETHLQCVLRTYNEWQKLFPIFKRNFSHNSSRLSDTEKRRQDLEMSFRVAVRDTKDDEAGRNKLVSFLVGGEHTTSFLTQSLAGVGLGVSAKRLRSDVHFRLETLVIVQSGNKFWSEEFMGLTTDELIFIKPPNRLGISSRLCLRFESILGVENVDDASLPFIISGCSALKISTFSREYVVMMRGLSFRNAWQNTLAHLVEATTLPSVPHIDLLVRPKCWKLENRVILNARGYECASRVMAARSPEIALLSSYMETPHILVARLTNIVLSLAEQFDSSNEDMLYGGVANEDMQANYISFMNGVSLLQRINVSLLQKGSPETTCLLLNLFHCMLLHAMLVVGVPKHEAGWISLYTSCGYEAFGDIFTLAELQQCVIQPGGSDKDKFEFTLADLKDPRIYFALNNGAMSQPPVICIFEPVSLSEQLDTMTRLCLRSHISIATVDSSSNFVLHVPRMCKLCLKAFEEASGPTLGSGAVSDPSRTPLPVSDPSKTPPLARFVAFLAEHCDIAIKDRLLSLLLPGKSVTVKFQKSTESDHFRFRFLQKLSLRTSISI